MNNTEAAKIFTDAIRNFVNNPNNIDNLESYLSTHFDKWLDWCKTPEDIAAEMKDFANMKI